MAKYYYDKYQQKQVASYSNPVSSSNGTSVPIGDTQTNLFGDTSYTFSSSSGFRISRNDSYANKEKNIPVGTVIYQILGQTYTGKLMFKYTVVAQTDEIYTTMNGNNYYIFLADIEIFECTETIVWEKGNLLEVVQAEDGTYPDNGRLGGFWYVKRGLVFPELKVKVDGVIKTSERGWVKIDGVLKEIDRIWVKNANSLREV